MGRSIKPRKPYRRHRGNPRINTRKQPWLLETTFGPMKEMLDHIALHGSLEVSESEALVYRSLTTGKIYEVVEAIIAYAEIFGVMRLRDTVCPDVGPLRVLAAQLKDSQVSGEVLTTAAERLASVRSYAASQSPADLADAAQSVAIRVYLDSADFHARGDDLALNRY